MSGAWRSFRASDRRGRALAIEAAGLLVIASTGLRLLSFPTLRSVLDHCAACFGSGSVAPDTVLERIGRTVDAVADRLPMPTTCLVRALAADTILRRRGFASELRLGVRMRGGTAARTLEAHAWVECDERIVIGRVDDIDSYAAAVPGQP